MSLSKLSKEELELLPYTEIAEMYLKEKTQTKNTADLFKEICKLLNLTEREYENQLADFFQSLTTSKKFILLNDGKWDLRINHSVKIDIDEIYEEKDDLSEEETTEEMDEVKSLDEEDDDYGMVEDDYDDESLGDLTIIDEDDIEE